MVSIGTIGLIKAIQTFDPSKNIKLATYTSQCVENEIKMFLRKNKKFCYDISLETVLKDDSDGKEKITLADVLGNNNDTPANYVEDKITKTFLMAAINQLKTREKKLIRLRYGLDGKKRKSQKAVGKVLGLTQPSICKLEQRILKKLRRYFNKLELSNGKEN